MLIRRPFDIWLLSAALSLASLPTVLVASNRELLVWVNGVPLQLRSSTESGEPEKVAESIARRWERNGPTPVKLPLKGGRIILGRQRDAFHETASLSPGHQPGTTQIEYALRDLRVPIESRIRMPFVAPPDWHQVSVVRHGQSKSAPLTLLFRSSRDPSTAVEQLRRALLRAGWITLAKDSLPEDLLWAHRGSQHLEAAFAPVERGVRIVIQITGAEN